MSGEIAAAAPPFLVLASGVRMASATTIRFGYWPKLAKVEFSGGVIFPVEGLQELLNMVNETSFSKNDLMYPPLYEIETMELRGSRRTVPNSMHGAEMYPWYSTHILHLKDPPSGDLKDFRRNPVFFLLQCLSYIEGVRCLPEDWCFFGKLPLKNKSGANFTDVGQALDICFATWKSLADDRRSRLTNILHFYNANIGFKWFWERFSNEYMVFDACWRFTYPNDLVGTKKVKVHKERIRVMLGELRIACEDEQIKNIVSMRNNLVHELAWVGETFVGEGDLNQLRYVYELRQMNHRILGHLLGMRGPYFRSKFSGRHAVLVDQLCER